MERLNVRSGPGTAYDIIHGFEKTTSIEVVGQYGGWYKVVWQDKEGEQHPGWISGSPDYVEANEAAKEAPEIPEEEIPPIPTPKPTPAPIATLEATEQPAPPEAPTGQICGVGRSEGKCYERTATRTGNFPDGSVEPNGTLARYIPDPDIEISGKWLFGGRVQRIEGSDVIYLKGRGNDIFKIKIWYKPPQFYARMNRWGVHGYLEDVYPQIHPILGKDIIVGDYLKIALLAGGDNSKSTDENYQDIIETQNRDGFVWGYRIEIYQ